MNRRKTTIILVSVILLLLTATVIAGALMDNSNVEADFSRRTLTPSMEHPFGTDMLGRDVFTRTIMGLTLSLFVGMVAALVSSIIAIIVGVCAALGKGWVDHFANWLIDLTLSIPHTLLVILISVAAGRGWQGLMIGIIFTHWTVLARIVRGEVLQIRKNSYITLSRKFGHSGFWVITRHILPHMIPQYLVGLILLIPHAIMHEAGLTFLGFGLPPEQPAIGIILSESMRYLSAGMWWLAFFPGLALVIMVLLIDKLGECVKLLLSPATAQE